MLARRSKLDHPSGISMELPLLIPSFSSKGFGLHKHKEAKHEFSAVAYDLEEFGRSFNRAVLISAYDLHYKHFEAPDMPLPGTPAHLSRSELVFLDSGGYELSEDLDSSELRRSPHKPKKFDLNSYKQELEKLTKSSPPLPLVIANFDWDTRKKSLADQVLAARQLFGAYPQYATTFIIKPGKKTNVYADNLSDEDLGKLRGFDIIGVTEKELGKNLEGRLRGLMRLRWKLNEAEINAPIH